MKVAFLYLLAVRCFRSTLYHSETLASKSGKFRKAKPPSMLDKSMTWQMHRCVGCSIYMRESTGFAGTRYPFASRNEASQYDESTLEPRRGKQLSLYRCALWLFRRAPLAEYRLLPHLKRINDKILKSPSKNVFSIFPFQITYRWIFLLTYHYRLWESAFICFFQFLCPPFSITFSNSYESPLTTTLRHERRTKYRWFLFCEILPSNYYCTNRL